MYVVKYCGAGLNNVGFNFKFVVLVPHMKNYRHVPMEYTWRSGVTPIQIAWRREKYVTSHQRSAIQNSFEITLILFKNMLQSSNGISTKYTSKLNLKTNVFMLLTKTKQHPLCFCLEDTILHNKSCSRKPS